MFVLVAGCKHAASRAFARVLSNKEPVLAALLCTSLVASAAEGGSSISIAEAAAAEKFCTGVFVLFPK